jgi:hypothetical protein
MEYNTKNYKLLSFIRLFKVARANSVFFSDETAYSFIKKNNLIISQRTFKHYMKLSEDKGFLVQMGDNKQFIGWDKVIDKLNITPDVKFFNQYLNLVGGITSFSEMCKWVNSCYIRQGHSTQIYKIEQKAKLYNTAKAILNSNNKSIYPNLTSKEVKSFISKGRKFYGRELSTEELCSRVLGDTEINLEVVTGSIALANKYGYSHKTATNYINSMEELGLATKRVVRKFHKVDSLEAFNNMRSFKTSPNSVVFPSKDRTSVVEVLGTQLGYSGVFSKANSFISII